MLKWDTRGWTFQERILSPRCLYFSDRTVYFRCGKSHVLSDGGIDGRVWPLQKWWGSNREEVAENMLIRTLRDNNIHYEAEEKRTEKTFKAYTKTVEMYTKRQLTYDGDIINAFSGVLAALSTSFKSDHWCWLPAPALDLALLWAPLGRTTRRGRKFSISRTQFTSERTSGGIWPTNRGTMLAVLSHDEVSLLDENIDRRFPSWSWVGWKGAVDYRLFDDMRADEPPPVPLIGEFAINPDGGALRYIRGRRHHHHHHHHQAPIAPASASGTATTKPDQEEVRTPDSGQNHLPSPSSANGAVHSPSRQAVRRILESRGKRCGLWWEQSGYVYVGRGISPKAEAEMVFMGVSRHEDAATPRSGPYGVEAEVVLFDDSVYSKVGRGSGLVNVVAVDLDMEHDSQRGLRWPQSMRRPGKRRDR